ncbi:MAG: NADP-dependent isocitrate dehydrogenase, partial [Ilumatobacter sp.]|nr:NADP-dependent isocitrate dehydrogenase [Ilumatobacter sp.]
MSNSKIIYTFTDEAPALATYSLLPVIEAFAGAANVGVETRDISLAARILAAFPERMTDAQRVPDALAELGEMALTPEANIIKLPNISASVPQLKAAIAELQAQGYDLPEYPDDAQTDDEQATKAAYGTAMGSAVNPVLRQGNSDRRAPKAVKDYAQANPHSMGAWSSDSKSHVSTMSSGDFAHNEQSVTVSEAGTLRIEHVAADGSVSILKESIPVLADEVIDSTVMSVDALRAFLADQIADAKAKDVLFSLHLKATMMKVSDPIIFGHAVRAYFSDVFAEHGDALAAAGANPNNGLGNVISSLSNLPADKQAQIEADIAAAIENGPDLAMVDSDNGITNLHVPSDVIVDASMPAMIRTSGQMWNAAGDQQDVKATIPDSSYAGIYQVVIDDCIANGAYDPTTMGTVPNVGLMAQKAEEYGSHDKTFEAPSAGTIRVVDVLSGSTVMEHAVAEGDIFRACQVKDEPIRDWVRLAVSRARATGVPAVFWLDANRAHDAQLITKVNEYLQDRDLVGDTSGLTIEIMSPVDATKYSIDRMRAGEDTISVTGNVLRDYNT